MCSQLLLQHIIDGAMQTVATAVADTLGTTCYQAAMKAPVNKYL